MSGLMDKMATEPGIGNKSDNELRAMLLKRFKLNNIRDFNLKEHVQFDRHAKGTDIVMDYEIRIPLVYNVDLIAAFDKTVSLRD